MTGFSTGIGGAHLTNDLRLGLRLTKGQAEKLKLRYGRADVKTRKRSRRVWLDDNPAVGNRWFSQRAIEQITAARTREMFGAVKQELGDAFSADTCAAGVVITGGTAKLMGIAGVAAEAFGVRVRLGEAPAWVSEVLRDPGYHTAFGVLYYGVSAQP